MWPPGGSAVKRYNVLELGQDENINTSIYQHKITSLIYKNVLYANTLKETKLTFIVYK